MNITPLFSVSRHVSNLQRVCHVLALLVFLKSSATASSTFLLDETFSNEPVVTSIPRQLPAGWTLTTVGGALTNTNVGVVDYADPLFGLKLKPLQNALLVEDRDNNSYPILRAPWNTNLVTAPFNKGWVRIRFIPIEDSPNPAPTYTTPRLFYRLRSHNDVDLLKFQVNNGRLYYYDVNSPVSGYQFNQSVVNNAINDLLVWFDLSTRTLKGELNGVPLTRLDGGLVSNLQTGLLSGSDVCENIELRPGDTVSYQEGFLVTNLQVGQGDGPVDRQFATHGYVDVTVAARNIGNRSTDDMPASVSLNFPRLLEMAGYYGQRVQFSSLTIQAAANWPNGPALACRWYDAEAPRDFPSTTTAISYNDAKSDPPPPALPSLVLFPNSAPQYVPGYRNNLGALFPVFGYSGIGDLTWIHTQAGGDKTYRISFQTESISAVPGDPGPVARGWVSDGAPRFDVSVPPVSPPPAGPTPVPASITTHVRVTVTDWDGDGNQDIVFGDQSGLLFVMKNTAVVTGADPHPLPVFKTLEYVRDEFGDPISLGVHAAPVVVDWDGDGVEDLLVGTAWNRLVYLRNIGTNQRRKFRFEGLVKTTIGSTTSILMLPWLPWSDQAPSPGQELTRDYYPVVDVTDFNGDGKKDLLIGGYVTGRIFYYENTNLTGQYSPANPTAGIPVLKAPFAAMPDASATSPFGAIFLKKSDGTTVRDRNCVGDWCAAPTTMRTNSGLATPNFLVTGHLPRLGQTGAKNAPFVRLFQNIVGTRDFKEIPEAEYDPSDPSYTGLYFTGTAPAPALSSPRLADMNRDGLPDLVVSSGSNIYVFLNVGTATAPKWALNSTPITSLYCGGSRINGVSPVQFLDLNGDGRPDIYEHDYYSLHSSSSNPDAFQSARASIFATPITSHIPVANGPYLLSANTMSKLFDLNGDGKLDYFFGDPLGQIWFHRNIGTSSQPPFTFDSAGSKCQRMDGSDINVDLSSGSTLDQTESGARPVFTLADFDGDGIPDLVLGDTFGKVRFFKGTGLLTVAGNPIFNPETTVQGTGSRLAQIDFTDWDGDGDNDLVISAAGANSVTASAPRAVNIWVNNGLASFTKMNPAPNLPNIGLPASIMVDMNGDGGGKDIFMPSFEGSVWLERSFIDGGYPTISGIGGLTPY
jgi:uncharacterized protein (DUF2141 family)